MKHQTTKEQMDLILRLRDQGLSYRAIEKKIGISKSAIHSLVTTFVGNISAKPKTTMTTKRISGKRAPIELPKDGAMSSHTESAEEKIARLERELETAKLESELYKEIISVAEKKFRIPILKKLAPSNREPAYAVFESLPYRRAV